MNTIRILNPEGKSGPVVTYYTGRGAGIREHIELLDILNAANEEALRIYEEAKENGESFADISDPAHVAAEARRQLLEQASNN